MPRQNRVDPMGIFMRSRPVACSRGTGVVYWMTVASGAERPVLAFELNRRLAAERLRRGRGLDRANDRITWQAEVESLPVGSVILDTATGSSLLLTESHAQPFGFDGWGPRVDRPAL